MTASMASAASGLQERAWALPPDCRYTWSISAYGDVAPLVQKANLQGCQVALSCPDLALEATMLRRLLYKNSSQHRASSYMRRLRGIARDLRLLEELSLTCVLADLRAMTQLAAAGPSSGRASQSRQAQPSTKQTHRVPCQEAALCAMSRLVASAQMYAGLVQSCLAAAAELTAQISKSFFMPLCVTALAMLARIQVLSVNQAQNCATAYNALTTLLRLLPSAHMTPIASTTSTITRPLPRDLACVVRNNLPCVIDTESGEPLAATGAPPAAPAWLAAEAARLWDEYGLVQGLEPAYVGPTDALPAAKVAVGAGLQEGGPAPAVGTQQSKRQETVGAGTGKACADTGAVKSRAQAASVQPVRPKPGPATRVPPSSAPAAARKESFFDRISQRPTKPAPTPTLSTLPMPDARTLPAVTVDRGAGMRASTLASAPVYTTSFTLPGLGIGLGLDVHDTQQGSMAQAPGLDVPGTQQSELSTGPIDLTTNDNQGGPGSELGAQKTVETQGGRAVLTPGMGTTQGGGDGGGSVRVGVSDTGVDAASVVSQDSGIVAIAPLVPQQASATQAPLQQQAGPVVAPVQPKQARRPAFLAAGKPPTKKAPPAAAAAAAAGGTAAASGGAAATQPAAGPSSAAVPAVLDPGHAGEAVQGAVGDKRPAVGTGLVEQSRRAQKRARAAAVAAAAPAQQPVQPAQPAAAGGWMELLAGPQPDRESTAAAAVGSQKKKKTPDGRDNSQPKEQSKAGDWFSTLLGQ